MRTTVSIDDALFEQALELADPGMERSEIFREALRTFAIALIFGITIGTYSSIYVASPIILLWGVKSGDDEEPTLVGPAAQAAMAQKAAALKAGRSEN